MINNIIVDKVILIADNAVKVYLLTNIPNEEIKIIRSLDN
jgi:hypothetical protein